MGLEQNFRKAKDQGKNYSESHQSNRQPEEDHNSSVVYQDISNMQICDVNQSKLAEDEQVQTNGGVGTSQDTGDSGKRLEQESFRLL